MIVFITKARSRTNEDKNTLNNTPIVSILNLLTIP